MQPRGMPSVSLREIFRRWLPQSEIRSWDSYSSELENKLQGKEARLKTEVESQNWRFTLGNDPFITLAGGLEIKPLGASKFEKRDAEGKWLKVANPKKDIPSGDLIALQKLADPFLEVLQLRQAAKDAPEAVAEFKRAYEQHLETLRAAKTPVGREEALGQLRSFFEEQQEVLPLSCRKELLEAEFAALLEAFRGAGSSQELDGLREQLREFFRRHREDGAERWEEIFIREEHQREYRVRLEGLRQGATAEEIARQKEQLTAFVNKYGNYLGGQPGQEIQTAWTQALENNMPPPPPAGLRASSGREEGINLSWARSLGATQYQAYRSESEAPESRSFLDSIPAAAGSGQAPAFLDSSAAGGRDYYYWVKATNPKGESDFAGPAKGSRLKAAAAAREPLPQVAPPEVTARMVKAMEEGDILGAIEIYAGNMAHAEVWVGMLDETLVICHENARGQKEAAGAAEMAAILGSHRAIQKKLRDLIKADGNATRFKALTRISSRNNDFVAELEEHLRNLNNVAAEAKATAEAAAKRAEEEKRLANEKAKAEEEVTRAAEVKRLAEEKAKAEAQAIWQAVQKRVAEEEAKAEVEAKQAAEAKRLANEKAKAEAEAKWKAEQQRLETARVEAEAKRVAAANLKAEAKRKEDEKATKETEAHAQPTRPPKESHPSMPDPPKVEKMPMETLTPPPLRPPQVIPEEQGREQKAESRKQKIGSGKKWVAAGMALVVLAGAFWLWQATHHPERDKLAETAKAPTPAGPGSKPNSPATTSPSAPLVPKPEAAPPPASLLSNQLAQQKADAERSANARNLITTARSKWTQKDLTGAFTDASAAIDIGGSSLPEAYNLRGVVDSARGNLDAAISDYTHSIELHPTNASTVFANRALAKYKKNDLPGAIGDFNQSIDMKPTGLRLTERAWAYFQSGDIANARQDLQKALEMAANDQPAPLRAYKMQATGLLDYIGGDYQGAVTNFQAHLQAYTNPWTAALVPLVELAKSNSLVRLGPEIKRPVTVNGGVTATGSEKPYPVLDAPYENGLGMRFVPVWGTKVLFCVWLTRVQDFSAFVADTGYNATAGMYSARKDGWKQRGDTWKSPGFAQGAAHPVCGVSWEDAEAFCRWLTTKERAKGLLGENQSYRLPSDAEWSVAVDLTEPADGTPREKDGKNRAIFLWGNQWPPPSGAGNYAGSEAANGSWPSGWATFPKYNDGFARTSPVGSFAPNRFGLSDMGGNLWEWCEDWYDTTQQIRVLRGGSWSDSDATRLLSSYRNGGVPGVRYDYRGFRCVLVAGGVAR
jgi:hypothetical protein